MKTILEKWYINMEYEDIFIRITYDEELLEYIVSMGTVYDEYEECTDTLENAMKIMHNMTNIENLIERGQTMKKYMLFDTGEIYTLEEIHAEYDHFRDEMTYTDFDDYMDTMLSLGKQKIGGFVEVEEEKTLELTNSFDHELSITSVEQAKKYFYIDTIVCEDDKQFNEELAACENLYDCAEVLNEYSDIIGNGSRYEVREF